tara:strand:+ start:93 stop:389 length:297 start_codon:yes stop_codon:yes gene_type:complete
MLEIGLSTEMMDKVIIRRTFISPPQGVLELRLDETAGHSVDVFVLPNFTQRVAEFAARMSLEKGIHSRLTSVRASKHVLPVVRAPVVYHWVSQLETRR